jgi:hypothetical protein
MRKIRRIDFLPRIEKVGTKLPRWKGKLMSKAARAHATVFELPKWLIKKTDKLRRNFFWKGEDTQGNKGGACLVKWDVVCRPKEQGGLGINNLSHFGRVLRQRWLWYHWTDDNKPW